jgi:hypothetical protein
MVCSPGGFELFCIGRRQTIGRRRYVLRWRLGVRVNELEAGIQNNKERRRMRLTAEKAISIFALKTAPGQGSA